MSSIQETGQASNLLTSYNTKNTAKTAADDPQDRFLKLLVTQMKNQDPLNPLDNAQVTSQLAQISTVNGIEKLNTTLQAMANGFTAGQSLQAAGMIGHNVLVPGSALQLTGGNGAFGVDLAQPADDVKVTIKDDCTGSWVTGTSGETVTIKVNSASFVVSPGAVDSDHVALILDRARPQQRRPRVVSAGRPVRDVDQEIAVAAAAAPDREAQVVADERADPPSL